ncbi:MAG: hypothetical protein H2069_05660 [Legionella sp.]|nr:hypothetical protein [Legionella sp.]
MKKSSEILNGGIAAAQSLIQDPKSLSEILKNRLLLDEKQKELELITLQINQEAQKNAEMLTKKQNLAEFITNVQSNLSNDLLIKLKDALQKDLSNIDDKEDREFKEETRQKNLGKKEDKLSKIKLSKEENEKLFNDLMEQAEKGFSNAVPAYTHLNSLFTEVFRFKLDKEFDLNRNLTQKILTEGIDNEFKKHFGQELFIIFEEKFKDELEVEIGSYFKSPIGAKTKNIARKKLTDFVKNYSEENPQELEQKVKKFIDRIFPLEEEITPYFQKVKIAFHQYGELEKEYTVLEKEIEVLKNENIIPADNQEAVEDINDDMIKEQKGGLFNATQMLMTKLDDLSEEIKVQEPIQTLKKALQETAEAFKKNEMDKPTIKSQIAAISHLEPARKEILSAQISNQQAIRDLERKIERNQPSTKLLIERNTINLQRTDEKAKHQIKAFFKALVTLKNKLFVFYNQDNYSLDFKDISTAAVQQKEFHEAIASLDVSFSEHFKENSFEKICESFKNTFTALSSEAKAALAIDPSVMDDLLVMINKEPIETYNTIEPILKQYWEDNEFRLDFIQNNDSLEHMGANNPYEYDTYQLVEGLRAKTDKERTQKIASSAKAQFEKHFNVSKYTFNEPDEKLINAVADFEEDLSLKTLSDLKKDTSKRKTLINDLEELAAKADDHAKDLLEKISKVQEEISSIDKALESNQTLMNQAPNSNKKNDLKEFQKALKARKEVLKNHQTSQETIQHTLEKALIKLNADSKARDDGRETANSKLMKLLMDLDSNKQFQRMASPEDVYIVQVFPEDPKSNIEALKVLADQKNPNAELQPLVICDRDDEKSKELFAEKKTYDQLESYRVVDIPRDAPNPSKTSDKTYHVYFEQSNKHAAYIESIREEKDPTQLSAPEATQKPTVIKVCEPNEKFSKVHTEGENFPSLKDFGSNKAAYHKAFAHAALQMAIRDLQRRVGEDLHSPDASAQLKKLQLTLYAPNKEYAVALYTAYALILQYKCGLSRNEIRTMLAVKEPSKKFDPKSDIYNFFLKGFKCPGFNDKSIQKFYEISPAPGKSSEQSKHFERFLKDASAERPDDAPRPGRPNIH